VANMGKNGKRLFTFLQEEGHNVTPWSGGGGGKSLWLVYRRGGRREGEEGGTFCPDAQKGSRGLILSVAGKREKRNSVDVVWGQEKKGKAIGVSVEDGVVFRVGKKRRWTKRNRVLSGFEGGVERRGRRNHTTMRMQR